MVRTRMAPSPTGEYHIGHLRTLLYNVAFAKKHSGKFIVRIEDTDRKRFVPGASEKILQVIKDYGFDWDEGPGVGGPYAPYVQSERLSIYREYALQLVEGGHAYYCFCSPRDLKDLREKQEAGGNPPKYNKNCLKLSPREAKEKLQSRQKYVIRLNVPKDETITFKDEVYGDLSFDSNEIDDQVLLKSDGFPTYHLGVVVDDHLMGITHILRGNDWLPSTPKHILLYKAFGWELPIYAHLPNLKESDGTKKLSKRYGAVSARQFLEEGYLPEAVVNFLMFLGWNPGTEKEIYTLDEFIKDFSLERVHKTDLVAFDREKLLWCNGCYIRNLSVEDLYTRVMDWSKRHKVDLDLFKAEKNQGVKVLSLVQERMKKLSELSSLTSYFFVAPTLNKDLAGEFSGSLDRAGKILSDFYQIYNTLSEKLWEAEEIEKASELLLKKEGYKPKEAYMTLRMAVTGNRATPPIFDVLEVLGKAEAVKRIKSALLAIDTEN